MLKGVNRRLAALAAILVFAVCSSSAAELKPTYKDVRYSEVFKRSTLDFWKPKGNTPAPLVVYFHGGSFKAGDKSSFYNHRILREYYPRGIAFASVNYPFLDKANYLKIMAHTADSIKFLKSKAKAWNIDPRRISVMGVSAGAMISEYLTYWTGLRITGCFAEQQPHRSCFLLILIRKGGPPLVLYTRSGPNDKVHNPDHAKLFKKHCDRVGVKCELYGTKASGLPQLPNGVTIERRVMQVFSEQWEHPKN